MSRSVRNWINSKMSKSPRGQVPLPKEKYSDEGEAGEYVLVPTKTEIDDATAKYKKKSDEEYAALVRRMNPDFRALRELQNRNNTNTNRTGTGTRKGSGLFGRNISRGGRLFKSKKNRKSKGKKNKNKKNTRRINK